MNDYITLKNTDETLEKRFWSVKTQPRLQRAQTINRTIGGGLDITYGGIYKSHRVVLIVPEEIDVESYDEDFGVLSDLETFFSYNNPNGEPSTVITYIDHGGNSHECYLVGDMPADPATRILYGTEAYYLVPIELLFIPS